MLPVVMNELHTFITIFSNAFTMFVTSIASGSSSTFLQDKEQGIKCSISCQTPCSLNHYVFSVL